VSSEFRNKSCECKACGKKCTQKLVNIKLKYGFHFLDKWDQRHNPDESTFDHQQTGVDYSPRSELMIGSPYSQGQAIGKKNSGNQINISKNNSKNSYFVGGVLDRTGTLISKKDQLKKGPYGHPTRSITPKCAPISFSFQPDNMGTSFRPYSTINFVVAPNQDRNSKDLSGISELPSRGSIVHSQRRSGSMTPSEFRKNKSKIFTGNRKSTSPPNSGDDQVKIAEFKRISDGLSCDRIQLPTSPPKRRISSMTNQVNSTVGPQSIDGNQSTPKKEFRFGGTDTTELEHFYKNHRPDGHAVVSVKYVGVTGSGSHRKGSSFSRDRMGKYDLEKHHLTHNSKKHLDHSSSSIYYGK
jgi:hypothetical protein